MLRGWKKIFRRTIERIIKIQLAFAQFRKEAAESRCDWGIIEKTGMGSDRARIFKLI